MWICGYNYIIYHTIIYYIYAHTHDVSIAICLELSTLIHVANTTLIDKVVAWVGLAPVKIKAEGDKMRRTSSSSILKWEEDALLVLRGVSLEPHKDAQSTLLNTTDLRRVPATSLEPSRLIDTPLCSALSWWCSCTWQLTTNADHTQRQVLIRSCKWS